MLKTMSFCVAAILAASPAFAQSVVVSESSVQTQALSPSLGATESLPLVSPELAAEMIEIPMVEGAMVSGEVSPSLGSTETMAVVTPVQAETMMIAPAAMSSDSAGVMMMETTTMTETMVQPLAASTTTSDLVSERAETSILDTLPRIAPAIAEAMESSSASIDRSIPLAEEETSIYVVGDGTILPASAWGARDSEACKASGGIELPLPGSRIACFKL